VVIIKSYLHDSFDEIYRIADEFLYKAKESGRNKIVGKIVSLENK
jgi:PleD family two-component response regulator